MEIFQKLDLLGSTVDLISASSLFPETGTGNQQTSINTISVTYSKHKEAKHGSDLDQTNLFLEAADDYSRNGHCNQLEQEEFYYRSQSSKNKRKLVDGGGASYDETRTNEEVVTPQLRQPRHQPLPLPEPETCNLETSVVIPSKPQLKSTFIGVANPNFHEDIHTVTRTPSSYNSVINPTFSTEV